jgi:hypothetical protein
MFRTDGLEVGKVAMVVVLLLVALQGAVARAGGAQRYFETGRAMVERGDRADGLRAVAVAIALDAGKVRARSRGARSYLVGVLDSACCRDDIGLHETVATVLPRFPPVIERLAALYERDTRYEEAGALRLRTTGLRPDEPAALKRLAVYFEFMGDLRHARAARDRYRRMVEAAPEIPPGAEASSGRAADGSDGPAPR